MIRFTASIQSKESAQVLRELAQQSPYADEPPQAMLLEFEVAPMGTDWVATMLAARNDARAKWRTDKVSLGYRRRSDLVVVSHFVPELRVAETLLRVGGRPCVVGLGSVFFDEWIEADYDRWSFSRGHIDHGWGCAFRGVGHDHLVSRRWLDFGPWRTIRLPDDTTFVQFHDLAITDPAEAYAVAKVGHERMGVSYTGGFIQQVDQWMLDDAKGAYTAQDRKLHVVVAEGVEVPQLRMLNAATLRRHYRLNPGEPEPVERIAFVFVHEGQARAHLHELWLRELECWVHDARGLRRLDADYHPTPTPPDWARRLDASSG